MKNRIRELRKEKRMTQIRLSIELEVTQETVSAYEIGRHYPSAASLIKMADLFGASIDYILGLSPVRKMVLEQHLPDDEVRIITLYRKMDNNQKEKSTAYMQGLIQDI